MPVSASQHRVTAGTYQNKLHDNIRGSSTTQAQSLNSDRSGFPDEILRAGSRIERVVNSHEELIRQSYQTTSPRQGIAAPLLMLLSQVRLDGIPISSTANISAFTSERSVSPPVSRDTAHSDNSGNGFSTMLSPVANALYETGQFIARNDPLKFPVADASPVPLAETESTTVASVVRDSKGDSYIITGEQKKKELISSVVQYLVSDGQMTADEGKDVELRLLSEAAGMPMVAARLDNEEVSSGRSKRALAAENDPRTAEHIKEHCAFEEEVLDAQGENRGKVLIFQAQRAENPFRMIYDNNPHGRPSPEERGVADGLNISADILTLGVKYLIGKLIANAKRREYYQNQGDEICAERFKRLFIAEMATSLDVGGLAFTRRGSAGKVRPSELRHALPEQERAAFFTRNPHTGIRKEILLELKQGNSAINDNGRKVYLKPTKRKNEFITYHPDAVKPELLERRVIVDENNLSWRYADSFDTSGLNVEISEGKRQIRLHGENYELHQNGEGKYEIVVNKASGIKEYVPVYMEPLSRTWHLNTHNEHPVFSNKQADIVKDIKVNKEDGFYYISRVNVNQNYYGNGNIYVQEKMGDSGHYPYGSYVEMNGELVPVKEIGTPGHGVRYEVYALKFPEKAGHPIEWDGNRWLFERKTSVHVSKDLKNLISPKMVDEKVDAGKLSAPDHQGLRYDADGNNYLKINGKYVGIREISDGIFKLQLANDNNIILRFKKNKFHIDTTAERLWRIKTSGLSGRGSVRNTLDYDKNCVAMALSKTLKKGTSDVYAFLVGKGLIKNPKQLENLNTIQSIMSGLKMDKFSSDASWSSTKEIMKSKPDGRYFAINSGKHSLLDDKAAHAFSIIMNKKSLGVAGNNAESTGHPYNQVINDEDLITVWGPFKE
ncbi:hypothetical protein [Erwinia tasmaniensis]|uniref:hypothetical protein n=1 Tax=Erwinia tasmaniensis TaxID=338565 RepID=UPI003A4D6464